MIIKKSSLIFFISLSSLLLLLLVVSPSLFSDQAFGKQDDEKSKIKNLYFSMDINDNWVFEEYAPNSAGTKLLGFGLKAGALCSSN